MPSSLRSEYRLIYYTFIASLYSMTSLSYLATIREFLSLFHIGAFFTKITLYTAPIKPFYNTQAEILTYVNAETELSTQKPNIMTATMITALISSRVASGY